MKRTLLIITLLVCAVSMNAQTIKSQWAGRRVAFLGDSITDAGQLVLNDTYWNIMVDLLGIEPYVYGISGHRMSHIIGQAQKLEEEHGQDFDAIMIFVGTNDFNSSVPIGEWFEYDTQVVNKNGQMVELKHRTHSFDPETFRGCTNEALKYLKHHFPTKQIILLTPIHRAYAEFSPTNLQPDESYANLAGEFIDAYVDSVKEASSIWAMPLIDLNADCGLYPLDPVHSIYFRNTSTDMLHPNTAGHYRMALTISYQLLGIPVL